MIDDSVPFDGTTPATRALGGAEKAFAGLASALAGRGHAVTAVNRCDAAAEIEGVQWLPWDMPRPPQTDILIAFRQPQLLVEADDPSHRILWIWGAPEVMNKPANQSIMDRYRPAVVFVGGAQRRAWKSWRDFREFVIVPGTLEAYTVGPTEEAGSTKKIAIVTTHPLIGLKEIVRLWRRHIHSESAGAELQIYSAALARAAAGGEIDARLKDIAEEIEDAKGEGVSVIVPMADAGMAAVYRTARVHLYPAAPREMYCSTLAESQAAGLPAIVRTPDAGNEAVTERVRNGQTGYLVPDDDALANVAVEVLTNDPLFESLRRDTRTLQAGRGWGAAALDFEMLWATD